MRPRPVILILIKGLGIGGAERLISEAAVFWDRSRFDYRVAYLLPWKNQLVTELEEKHVPVAMLGSRKGLGPRAALQLRRFVNDVGAQLVHAHLPSAGILARSVSPVPVVYTEHNLVESYRLPTRLLNRLTYARNARVVAVSEAVADSVRGYPGRPAEVIANGVKVSVSPQETAAARAELGVSAGTELVVHVGNIRPYKGHATLIAASQWLANHRPGVVVVSIGGEKFPGDLERIRALAVSQGADGVIRFLGRREEARAFLAAADVVVNPSDVEGLPVALLEALALERPVVATAVGGVPALIQHEVTGLLVPPGEPESLAAGVERLLSDRDLAGSLAKAGKDVVEELYGIESMVHKVEALYDEVLGG